MESVDLQLYCNNLTKYRDIRFLQKNCFNVLKKDKNAIFDEGRNSVRPYSQKGPLRRLQYGTRRLGVSGLTSPPC